MEDRLAKLQRLRADALDAQAKADDAYAALHEAVAEAHAAGESASEIARRLGINRVSVYRMVDRWRASR